MTNKWLILCVFSGVIFTLSIFLFLRYNGKNDIKLFNLSIGIIGIVVTALAIIGKYFQDVKSSKTQESISANTTKIVSQTSQIKEETEKQQVILGEIRMQNQQLSTTSEQLKLQNTRYSKFIAEHQKIVEEEIKTTRRNRQKINQGYFKLLTEPFMKMEMSFINLRVVYTMPITSDKINTNKTIHEIISIVDGIIQNPLITQNESIFEGWWDFRNRCYRLYNIVTIPDGYKIGIDDFQGTMSNEIRIKETNDFIFKGEKLLNDSRVLLESIL